MWAIGPGNPWFGIVHLEWAPVDDTPTVVIPTVPQALPQRPDADLAQRPSGAGDHTQVIPALPPPPPVFVDPSGQRRRRLRRLAYGLTLLALAYTGMVGVSFAGASVSPSTILPFLEPKPEPEPWQPPPALPVSPEPTPSARQTPGVGRPGQPSTRSSSAPTVVAPTGTPSGRGGTPTPSDSPTAEPSESSPDPGDSQTGSSAD
jgi:hypothetical protein